MVGLGLDNIGRAYLARGQRAIALARLLNVQGAARKAETLARAGLSDLAAALNWLEDGPTELDAHFSLDQAGKWVRESFGCWIHRDGELYEQRCPVAIAHVRVGLSPGMKNVERLCSICNSDPRTCRHIRGREYVTTRVRLNGKTCNFCGTECEVHRDGETRTANCWHLIVRADLEEVSMVNRPAQPLARLMALPVSHERLRELAGPDFVPGMPLSCDNCLTPCSGLIEIRL